MFYTIYQTTNKINGKVYIGKHKTANLDDDYLGSGIRLQRAISKYGVENFTREILHLLNSENAMNAKEREIVNEEFLKRDDVYNLKLGGDGGFDFLNTNGLNNANKDWRVQSAQQSITAKKMWNSPGYREWHKEKNSKLHREGRMHKPSFAGKTHSEDTRKQMSASHAGKHVGEKNSQFGTMWITDGSKSKKISKFDMIPEGWYQGRKTCRVQK
jgi:NUMOD3 motif